MDIQDKNKSPISDSYVLAGAECETFTPERRPCIGIKVFLSSATHVIST